MAQFLGRNCGFVLFFFGLNYHRYAMPDALSVTVGRLVGAYIFAWIVLRVTKLIVKARAPESKYFCLVVAAITVGAQAFKISSRYEFCLLNFSSVGLPLLLVHSGRLCQFIFISALKVVLLSVASLEECSD